MSFKLSRELVGEYNKILMQMDVMPREWYEKLETYYRLAHQREKKFDRAFEKILGKDDG